MGRYYSGDIDGKFWFALQSSDCADRFAVCKSPKNKIRQFVFFIQDAKVKLPCQSYLGHR
jgi:hypothetical protein